MPCTARPSAMAVHPHARGERTAGAVCADACGGSSPRTWGTRRAPAWRSSSGRFIPTHVGNASWCAGPAMRRSVHPHARGERAHFGEVLLGQHGSSPRTWGTRHAVLPVRHTARFIPTHVGNAWPRRRWAGTMTVHPHARGERFNSDQASETYNGSSPRTWGTRPSCWASPRCSAVHPHARGERGRGARGVVDAGGSSPRTWGTPSCDWRKTARHRFIPTHVGNATVAGTRSRPYSVHPHARGERLRGISAIGRLIGSSPRTWGTRWRGGRGSGARRFIPTHVGNA